MFQGRFQTAILGARWYPDTDLGGLIPYLTAGTCASFNPTGAVHPTDPGRKTGFDLPFYPFVGVGGDWMLLPHLGLNLQLGTPIFSGFRIDANIKTIF